MSGAFISYPSPSKLKYIKMSREMPRSIHVRQIFKPDRLGLEKVIDHRKCPSTLRLPVANSYKIGTILSMNQFIRHSTCLFLAIASNVGPSNKNAMFTQ
jgi:hypothetical protein